MENKVLVETSARHVHVSESDLETLYGKGFKLSNKKNLSQPGQFASNEKVEVIGTKGSMKMSILGPCRDKTQVEISLTDARSLGIDAPIRESGDLVGSAPAKIVGPKGEIELKEGVIVAKRHVHFDVESGKRFNVKDKEIIEMRILTGERALIFDDVICRVGEKHALAMHLDVDEGNAANCKGEVFGEVIKK
ncbi:MAG: phosphate propanoyltransferase [Oscillospiraceae bacterium]